MLRRLLLPCLLLSLGGTSAVAQTGPADPNGVGLDELVQGRNAAAIREITANNRLATDDPARHINLAVAYAREGLVEKAKAHFQAALLSPERATLQTAQGDWVDSRHLARQGLRKLATGGFGARFAAVP